MKSLLSRCHSFIIIFLSLLLSITIIYVRLSDPSPEESLENRVKTSCITFCLNAFAPFHQSWQEFRKLTATQLKRNESGNEGNIDRQLNNDINITDDFSLKGLGLMIMNRQNLEILKLIVNYGQYITDRIINKYQHLLHEIGDYSFRLSKLNHVTQRSHTTRKERSESKSRTTIFASSRQNIQIQMYEKRIGQACDPGDDSSGQQQNIEQFNNLENVDNDMDHRVEGGEPYVGMLLQIFPQHSEESIPQQSVVAISLQENDPDKDYTSIQIRDNELSKSNSVSTHLNYRLSCKAVTSLSDNGKQPTSGLKLLINANQYQLVELVHRSLGNIHLHDQDYAYRPVMLLGSSAAFIDPWFWREGGSEFDYARMGQRAFAGGSHGEVWKARRRCNQIVNYGNEKQSTTSNHFHRSASRKESSSCDDKKELILKRIKVGKDTALMEAGLREVYFGDILSRSDESYYLFTMYVDHFFLQPSFSSTSSELWIVFENAGASLRSYIYTPVNSGGFVVYQHSPLWRQLRMDFASTATPKSSSSSVEVVIDHGTCSTMKPTESENVVPRNTINWYSGSKRKPHRVQANDLLKDILKQILRSAAKLHERGIIHRDIKPSNIMCRKDEGNQYGINCVLGDFSSAWDDFSSEHFYSKGPTAAEQTNEYAPPEVLFGQELTPFFKAKPESYDSWSIGVVILELMLGTPNVFSVDQRTTTLLTNKMKKENATEEDIQKALYLAALSQFCIYVPTNESDKNWPLREGDPLFKASIVKKTCTIHDFHSALRARDPLGIGFDRSMDSLLQLIWGLLAWDPKNRLTATEAIDHFYFTNVFHRNDEEKHALEPQMLDPRLDMDIEKQKIDSFVCPKCGRKFGDLRSCQAHTTGRKHSKFCTYDRRSLPPCLNAHSMLPSHPTSGYCDIQGRRRVIEDFHTVHLEKDHQFFGIFDGHSGNLASKYASRELYKQFIKRLEDIDDDIKSDDDWKREVDDEMKESFDELHKGVLDVIKSYPTGAVMSKSGTTATALFVTEYAVIVASVGDSRAVLSIGTSYDTTKQASSIQLTVDHVASDKDERKRIEDLGGSLSERGGVLRVNGTLVLSRSIGDAHLAEYLSRTPNVVAMTKQEVKARCKTSSSSNADQNNGIEMPCFIILASDGLWDVMNNQEAVDLVEQVIQKYDSVNEIGWEEHGGAFQEAAEVLTQEAYVRGSTDNIGVCVVAIT